MMNENEEFFLAVFPFPVALYKKKNIDVFLGFYWK